MLEISFYFSVNRKDKLHFLILFWKVFLFVLKKKTRILKGNRWLNVCVIFICSGSDLNLFLLSSYRHLNYKQFLLQCWLMNWCDYFCLISFHFNFAMWMTLFRAYKCWCISSLCIYFVRVTMCWPFFWLCDVSTESKGNCFDWQSIDVEAFSSAPFSIFLHARILWKQYQLYLAKKLEKLEFINFSLWRTATRTFYTKINSKTSVKQVPRLVTHDAAFTNAVQVMQTFFSTFIEFHFHAERQRLWIYLLCKNYFFALFSSPLCSL